MDQKSIVPIYKTKPMRPLLYTHLVTSNPDSYQISKRIKGILAYSEHFKDSRQKHPFTRRDFSLRSRDYRKARGLTLEIWHPVRTSKYWKKFLKSLKNTQKIQIKVLEIEIFNEGGSIYYAGVLRDDILKEVCQILCKVHWLQRIQIDFGKNGVKQARDFLEKTKCLRVLPRLKDLAITLDGDEAFPFSMNLLRVGFACNFSTLLFMPFNTRSSAILVEDPPIIEELLKKAPPKFKQLDTIKINSKDYGSLPDKLIEGLSLLISRLPNFRELDLNYSKNLKLPLGKIAGVLDALFKAPKLEVFRMGLEIQEISQLYVLNHPVFKRISLDLSLSIGEKISLENLNKIVHLLGGMPSLYELYLDFSNYGGMNDEIADGVMEKVSVMKSIRKLKLVFGENRRVKFAGNIVRRIFNNMPFLEELDLRLTNNGIGFARENEGPRYGEDIQGLPRLTKACIEVRQCEAQMEKSVWRVLDIIGKCRRLRELELDITDSVHDFEGTMKRLLENLVKLKGLQVFKLKTNLVMPGGLSLMVVENQMLFLRDFMETFDKMRNLQDFYLEIKPALDFAISSFGEMSTENNKKYRFYDLRWQKEQRFGR